MMASLLQLAYQQNIHAIIKATEIFKFLDVLKLGRTLLVQPCGFEKQILNCGGVLSFI